MPIYEYECRKCAHTLDALQKISDEPLVDCPECGEPSLKRLLSAPRFRLKGTGWYETDFKSDKQKNLAGDREAEKSDKDKKSDDKADTKKEPKETAKEPKSDKGKSKKTASKKDDGAASAA